MKKLLTILAASTLFAVAAPKIFLDYEYDTPIEKIEGLKPVENQSVLPKPLKVFEDENHQFFGFLDGKLKTVFVVYDDYDVKTEIEKILKNGFRLKKITFRDKYGIHQIKNVKELLEKIEENRNRELFDTLFEADLVFENGSGARIVMDIKEVYHRKMKECAACNYIDAGTTEKYRAMTIFFTKSPAK